MIDDEEIVTENGEELEQIPKGSELDAFESVDIEAKEALSENQTISVIESILFSTEKPVSVAVIKQAFKGTTIKSKEIRQALQTLAVDYADDQRGISLEEIKGGFQLRTKIDNMNFLRRMIKSRPFKLSGPALEVLSIVAYKQPCIKFHVDEIRGVESGHLMRALMEKSLVRFAGKSEFPGKPMLYETTGKFLEIFGLRNIRELPSLSEIDDLIPEGIGDVEQQEKIGDLTESLSQNAGETYSEGEDELMKISDDLSSINTSSDFFEKEKRRQREKRDRDRAQDIREALEVDEEVEDKDKKWLAKYDEKLQEQQRPQHSETIVETKEAVETKEVVETKGQDQVKIGDVSFEQLGKDLDIFDSEV